MNTIKWRTRHTPPKAPALLFYKSTFPTQDILIHSWVNQRLHGENFSKYFLTFKFLFRNHHRFTCSSTWNNTERFHTAFTQILLMVASCSLYYNTLARKLTLIHDTHLIQILSILQALMCVWFYQMFRFLLPSSQPIYRTFLSPERSLLLLLEPPPSDSLSVPTSWQQV